MLILDIGNSAIKATDGERETLTPSVVGEAQQVWTDQQLWQVNGQFIGADAITYGKFVDYSLRERKSDQRTLSTLVEYNLCLYPLEKEIVFLLPFLNFHEEKATLIEMFNKPHFIKYQVGDQNGARAFLPKMVNALPQGFVAGMDWLLDEDGVERDKKMLAKNILIVDIGFLTVNYIFLSRGKVVQNKSFSSLNGMHIIYDRITAETGQNIYEIDLVNSKASLSPLYASLSRVIQTDIESHYRLSDIGLYLMCGGGSEPTFDHIPYENKILHGDVFSNARGGRKVANRLWGIEPGHSEAMAN